MIEKLHLWFQENKREFPWREERTPYKVWISEVMLQQTRASVVIPYFIRWMEQFPNIKSLAEAPLEKVIKAWEGLGYYSRARLLHEGAKEICARFGAVIPSSQEELASIRGLGPYTTGAILNFGFQKKAAAVDGNVARVLSRYFLIEENISRASVKRLLEEKALYFSHPEKPWVTAEALIELGATICLPRPRCSDCPIQENCLALKTNKTDALPIKNNPPEITDLFRSVAVIESEGAVLVKKEKMGKIMANLYEFPYFEMKKEIWSSAEWVRAIQKSFGIKAQFIRRLTLVKQAFTRYKVQLYPALFHVNQQIPIEGWEWILMEKLSELPFSSGHRKVMGLVV